MALSDTTAEKSPPSAEETVDLTDNQVDEFSLIVKVVLLEIS